MLFHFSEFSLLFRIFAHHLLALTQSTSHFAKVFTLIVSYSLIGYNSYSCFLNAAIQYLFAFFHLFVFFYLLSVYDYYRLHREINIFYARQHICYSAYMLSPVRLSVRRVYHRKTVEVRIMKFSPYGSPILLVFAG